MNKIILIAALLMSSIVLSQNHQYLGPFSSNGTSDYLESVDDVISIDFLQSINNALLES